PSFLYTLSLHDALPIFAGEPSSSFGSFCLSAARSRRKTGSRSETPCGGLKKVLFKEPALISRAVADQSNVVSASRPVKGGMNGLDRKSTRLNSSHLGIS